MELSRAICRIGFGIVISICVLRFKLCSNQASPFTPTLETGLSQTGPLGPFAGVWLILSFLASLLNSFPSGAPGPEARS